MAKPAFLCERTPDGALKFRGELTIFAAEELRQCLLQFRRDGGVSVVDLAEVDHVDGAAAQIFRALQKSEPEPLTFRRTTELVRQNLLFCGFKPEQFE